jgi:hypothetical protein
MERDDIIEHDDVSSLLDDMDDSCQAVCNAIEHGYMDIHVTRMESWSIATAVANAAGENRRDIDGEICGV